MKSCHFYRIDQCSSKNSMTLSSFSMTFPWPLVFSMTFQAWKNGLPKFHDFPWPGGTLCLEVPVSALWTIKISSAVVSHTSHPFTNLRQNSSTTYWVILLTDKHTTALADIITKHRSSVSNISHHFASRRFAVIGSFCHRTETWMYRRSQLVSCVSNWQL